MKELSVFHLTEGDVLARQVQSQTGPPLLRTRTKLTSQTIQYLKRLQIKTVSVADPIPHDLSAADSHELQQIVYDALTDLLESHHLKGRIAGSGAANRFKRIFCKILFDVPSNRFIVEKLVELFETDKFLFAHSLNVSVLSCMIGAANHYHDDQMVELAIGSLLFDIGMTAMPKELLTNKRNLSRAERKQLEEHTVRGYQILSSHPGIPKNAALCALQHHERYDGTGYPYGTGYSSIHPYARIVGISDAFIALTSPGNDRGAYTYAEARDFLFSAGTKYFDLPLIKTLLRHVAVYPVSSIVLLNNGQIGKVVSVDENIPHRPVVKIIKESNGAVVGIPYEIDLRKHPDLVIVNGI